MAQGCCPVSGCSPTSKFEDIGKDARELLTSNYHFGLFKLSSKTKAVDNIEFSLNGTHNLDNNSFNGFINTKWISGNVTLSEKWSSNNVLTTSVLYNFSKLPGLKGELVTDFTPDNGFGSNKLQVSYQRNNFIADVSVFCPYSILKAFPLNSCCSVTDSCCNPEKKSGCPVSFTTTTVFSKNAFKIGFQTVLSPSDKKTLQCASLITSYKKPSYEITGKINDKSQFSGSVFHNVNEKVSVAAKFGWNNCNKSSCLVGGFNYKLQKGVVFGAHIDNNLKVGLSYLLPIADGVKLTLSSQINSSQMNQSGHKYGFSLNFDP